MKHRIWGIGLSTIDICFKEKKNERIHKELEFLKISFGGTIGNSLAVAGVLGSEVYYKGRIGCDSLGKFKQQLMENAGINVIGSSHACEERDVILVSIDEKGERRFASATDHKGKINCQDLLSLIDDYDFIVLDGHYLNDVKMLLYKIKLSKKNITIFVTLSKPEPEIWPEGALDVLPYADYIIGGEGILKKIENCKKYATEMEEKIFIETNGSKAIKYKNKGTTEHIEIPLFIENILDTTGAGDFFLGAFLNEMSNEIDIKESIIRASKVATYSCMYIGNSYLEVLKSGHR